MADFITLINDVARESGTMGSQALGAIASAKGRWVKVIGWTRQAWELIQRERSDWTFLRKEAEVTLSAGVARYSAADLLLTDVRGWLREVDGLTPYTIYDPAIGRSDELRLPTTEYRLWRESFDIGVHTANRPYLVAIDNERRLCFGSTPDKPYTVRLAYRRAVQTLAADGDEPYIHEDFHDAIVWRALMLLGDDDEAPIETASSAANYYRIRDAMMTEYLDPVSL